MSKNNINWIEAPMPDSSPGTKLVTYFVNDTESRSRLMLVEFPVGFTREQTGHYPAYEELLILDGSLKISGHEFKKDDYVLFPPNFTRSNTRCPEGCLALVWWSSKPGWSRGKHEQFNDEIIFKLNNDIKSANFIELNKNGEFNLEVYNGIYELIISHIGFQTIKYNFDTSTYTKPLEFSLLEEESLLDEVVINGKENNEEWEYNFSVFIREFIGTSEFSKSCTIQNPKVLFFEFDSQNNILTAEAIEPLHIKNKALGYDIFYDLKHFSIEKKITKYLGYSYFKESKNKFTSKMHQ